MRVCGEYFLLCIVYLSPIVYSVPIDNGIVGDPKIECMGDQIGITFATQKPFTGRIFVRGYAAQKECVVGGSDHPPAINLAFTQCGLQRSRQLSPPGVIVYSTIVISFHPTFITKIDRSYKVSCYYLEVTKTVTADMEVSMLSTGVLTAFPVMPECRYEILVGGPNGTPVRYAKVGEQVYHKWTCDGKSDAYCMRVHSCTIDDGQGAESYMVINRQGCATDRYVLQNLEYLSDLMAGQETHVVKFADKTSLFFSCQIELLSKASESANCISTRPNCTESYGTVAPIVGKDQNVGRDAVLPAPAVFNESVKRRAARDGRLASSKLITDKSDFQVVGDMDLLRQRLTVFDLDEAPDFNPFNKTTPSPITLPLQPSSSTPENENSQTRTFDNFTVTGPICMSPFGFGASLFAILTIFVIALSAAIRYAVPNNRLSYNQGGVIPFDHKLHNIRRRFSFRQK